MNKMEKKTLGSHHERHTEFEVTKVWLCNLELPRDRHGCTLSSKCTQRLNSPAPGGTSLGFVLCRLPLRVIQKVLQSQGRPRVALDAAAVTGIWTP